MQLTQDINDYIKNITQWMDIISNHTDKIVNAEYIYNILSNIGYIQIISGRINPDILKSVQNLCADIEFSGSGNHAPSFTYFNSCVFEIDRYKTLCGYLKNGPSWWDEPEIEEEWEDLWAERKNTGLVLLSQAVEIEAVCIGKKIVGKFGSGWEDTWNIFTNDSKSFLKALFKAESAFFPLSDDVLQMMTTFFYLPQGEIKNFLYKIAAPNVDYAQTQCFRKIFLPDEALEVYDNIYEGYENSSVSLSYFYEAGLALKSVRQFILNICMAKDIQTVDRWQLSSSLEAKQYSETPMLYAGQKQYSIHIINSDMTYWGIRKDEKVKLSLPEDNLYFNGALFFSYKEYPTNAVLIRFDAFVDKEQFAQAIAETGTSFVRLPVQNVCTSSEDMRQIFLEQAADEVMGVEFVQGSQTDLTSAQTAFSINLPDIYSEYPGIIGLQAFQEKTQCADDYHSSDKLLKAASGRKGLEGGGSEKEADTADSMIMAISPISQDRDRIIDALKKIVHRKNGKFCCRTLFIPKDGRPTLGGVQSIKQKNVMDTIEDVLEEKEKYAMAIMGIANEEYEELLESALKEIGDAISENRPPDDSRLPAADNKKKIIWVNFMFEEV